MPAKFSIGDCVKLKHGESPIMTVVRIESSNTEGFDIQCMWFVDSKENYRTFPENALKECGDITPMPIFMG